MLVTATTTGGAGAVGDGTTDDTAAIQRAIATALATGDVIEFPVAHNATTGAAEAPYKYRITSPLYVNARNRLTLKGPGQIFIDAVSEGVICNKNPGDSEDIHLDGLNITGGTSSIVIRGANRVTISNCVIEEFSLNGVFVDSENSPHDTQVQGNKIYTTVNTTAVGVRVENNDTFVRRNIIRGCSTGIYLNANACQITENHIFPDDNGPTDYAVETGSGATHLIAITGNYFDNCRLAFVGLNPSGAPRHNTTRPPRDFDEGNGEVIAVRGNVMLIKTYPAVKTVIGGPANVFDNIVRDNS